MNIRLLLVLVVGLAGCGQQSLDPTRHTGSGGATGTGGATAAGGRTGAGGADAGRPTGPVENCTVVQAGCLCDPMTGLYACSAPGDGGASDAAGSGTGDDSCAPAGQAGSILGCVTGCDSDVTFGYSPVCSGGQWICPPGTFDVGACGRSYCQSPEPPFCGCNPVTGLMICTGPLL